MPAGVDPAEAVSLVLNYVTAHQMLHRTARVTAGDAILVHSAAGGVGSALLELGRLVPLATAGTASPAKHDLVARLGCTPIDYKGRDFVAEGLRLQPDGFHAVFDGIGGPHLRRSLRVLRRRGRLVAYGLGSTLVGGRQSAARIVSTCAAWLAALAHNLAPNGKRVLVYSIQMRKQLRPREFRDDLATLLELLATGRIAPVIAARLPLVEAARAQALLAAGSTVGKIVLTCE